MYMWDMVLAAKHLARLASHMEQMACQEKPQLIKYYKLMLFRAQLLLIALMCLLKFPFFDAWRFKVLLRHRMLNRY